MNACLAFHNGTMSAYQFFDWFLHHHVWEVALRLGMFKQAVLLCGGA